MEKRYLVRSLKNVPLTAWISTRSYPIAKIRRLFCHSRTRGNPGFFVASEPARFRTAALAGMGRNRANEFRGRDTRA
jgi:hypothetical protein